MFHLGISLALLDGPNVFAQPGRGKGGENILV